MLGTERVRRTSELGVFWEVYGLESGDNIKISVVVGATQPGFLGRLASALGLRRFSVPVIVEWEEQATGADTDLMGRALHLGIEHLSSGEYTLEITVRRSGREVRTATRRIQIIDG
jgi:hypothetical protein